MSFTPLWGYQAAGLLAGRQLCAGCIKADPGDVAGGFKLGALAVDVNGTGTVHAGDPVTGLTACDLDANQWTWVVPTNPTPPAPAVEP